MEQAILDKLFEPKGYKGFRIVIDGSYFAVQRYGNIAKWTLIKSFKQKKRAIDAAQRMLQGE